LLTDTHDVEMMIVRSGSFERFLNNWCSVTKAMAFRELTGSNDIRATLLERAAPVGAMRLHSARTDLGLRFQEVRLDRHVSRLSLAVDLESLVGVVLQRSDRSLNMRTAVLESVEAIVGEEHDPFQLCSGHDLVVILSVGLRKALATKRKALVEPEVLERSMRSVFDCSELQKTKLYADMLGWETANAPFRVMAC